MGASNGGIVIRIDTINIDIVKVAKDLFGNDFDKIDKYCDTRKKDCIYIAKRKDTLTIINTDFANLFFKDQSTNSFKHILDYFGYPNFVFAFEEYDSGGTYSYSLIYDGQVKRQYRCLSGETTIDFGELDEIELKWKNAETFKEDIGDGDFQINYKHPEKDYTCSEYDLPQVILNELMYEKLGFDINEEDIIENAHFKKVVIINNNSQNSQIKAKKPWWKF